MKPVPLLLSTLVAICFFHNAESSEKILSRISAMKFAINKILEKFDDIANTTMDHAQGTLESWKQVNFQHNNNELLYDSLQDYKEIVKNEWKDSYWAQGCYQAFMEDIRQSFVNLQANNECNVRDLQPILEIVEKANTMKQPGINLIYDIDEKAKTCHSRKDEKLDECTSNYLAKWNNAYLALEKDLTNVQGLAKRYIDERNINFSCFNNLNMLFMLDIENFKQQANECFNNYPRVVYV